MDEKQVQPEVLEVERYKTLHELESLLELPVLVLGFIWLALLVIELVWGLNAFLSGLVYVIWAIFILDFVVRLILAPRKLRYLQSNWLTAVSLFIPALRLFRVIRLVQLTRLLRASEQLRLIRVLGSLNRGMRALRATMERRLFGYVVALYILVTLVSAAAMLAFERGASEGFQNYGEALYWTAMMMTTLGSAHWPVSSEGKVMAFLLAVYAFTMFGYVTATLATYFIGRDVESSEITQSESAVVDALQAEIGALRREIRALSRGERLPEGGEE
ncbi:MAG: ion transporter [Chloroflexota bacterium]